jgi:hypothetical protein
MSFAQQIIRPVGFSLRSRRKHKAWGVNPRTNRQRGKPVKRAVAQMINASFAHLVGSNLNQSFLLGLTPQALRFRLHSQAKRLCARQSNEF